MPLYLSTISDDGKKINLEVQNRLLIYRDPSPYATEIIAEFDDGTIYRLGIFDATVSRKINEREGHMEIIKDNNRYVCRDLGSTNGTYINGVLIPGWKRGKKSEPYPIKEGDIIRIGVYTEFRVEEEKNTLTLMEGGIVTLTKDDINLLPKQIIKALVSIDRYKNYVIINKNIEGEYKVGSLNIKIIKSDPHLLLHHIYLELKYLYEILEYGLFSEKTRRDVYSKLNLIIDNYKDILADIDEKQIKKIELHINNMDRHGITYLKMNKEVIQRDIYSLMEQIYNKLYTT